MMKTQKNMKNAAGKAATMPMPAKSEKKTQTEFGDLTGMSRQRVSRFVRDGIIPSDADGRIPYPAGLHALIDHLSETAAGRGGGSAQAGLAKERAKLAAAQREAVELKNAVARGEMLLARDVENRWATILSAIRSVMLALPSQISQLLPHLTRADLDVIDRAIRDSLNGAADEIGADK